MLSLGEEIKLRKNSLSQFFTITKRVLQHLPNVLSSYKEKDPYRLYVAKSGNTVTPVRPINQNLFIPEADVFEDTFKNFEKIFQRVKNRQIDFNNDDKNVIDSVLYTIQQSIGVGFDLFGDPNSARKHVGNRFEELVRTTFIELGVQNKKIVLQIPYETDKKKKIYKCETDLILSPYSKVRSTSESLDENEIVVSIKTSSKDRMGKIFMDRILMEHFVKHDIRMIGIFLNDVQRKKDNSISYTLVSGLFMIYTNFLTELEGVYYLDPPPNVFKAPYSKHMKPFSELITKDIWTLFTS